MTVVSLASSRLAFAAIYPLYVSTALALLVCRGI